LHQDINNEKFKIMNIEKMIKDGVTVIDVRTPGEFMAGHAPETKNIPLNEIPSRLEEIKNLPQPFALCCQSGARSGQATAFLQAQGLDCINAGSWLDVNFIKSNASAA
jgi:phage shock protein E